MAAPEPTIDEVDRDVDLSTPAAAPAVVAVVVTHNPGEWFEETLRSLAEQTYKALSVLVIDAESDDNPTSRIAAELPGAYVRRIDHNRGYGEAANEVIGAVEGAAFYLFCHDDVALAPDAVRLLVEEAFRSNAGIAGPKLVDWNDPRRVRQVGASIDKAGVLAPFAEPGELDQEQHDGVRDVFVVTGGAMLVRADLFKALGGFDEGIDFLGDDLNLCWRSHLAGARVLIVPSASVRHLEALGARRPADDRRRLNARHRLRTVLSCYRPFSLLRVLPQALLFSVIEALYALLAGQPRQAADVMSAWTWNLKRLPAIRRQRRQIRSFRTVADSEIRELQARGSARLSAFVRGQIGKNDERTSLLARAGRQILDTVRARSSRASLVLGVSVLALVVLGTRNLLFAPIPAIGELAPLPRSPNTLLSAWANGWRSVGLGHGGPAPTGLGLLGLLGWLFVGATGLLRKVLILGMLPVGFFGAWRLARPIGSLRAGIAAVVVYAVIPVPYNALASGAWGGLIVYGATPWVLLQLARASQLAPFGRADLDSDSPEAEVTPQSRRFGRQVISLGLLLALIGAFVPFVVVVALLVGGGFAAGSLLSGRPSGAIRILGVAVASSGVAAILHLPWTLDLLGPGAHWSGFAGIGASRGGSLSVAQLLGFETGPFGAPPLGWVFLIAAALPIVLGKGWRYQWAVRAWLVALAGWAVLWAGQEKWIPLALPPPEILLAPVSAALALTVAMGMAAFEVDLPGYRFGWRQAASSIAALAVVVGVLPLLGGAVDGRWHMADGDLNRPLSQALAQKSADGKKAGEARVLWVGDPTLLPVDGYRLDDRLSYGTTDGLPAIEDRWGGSPRDATGELGASLRLAAQRRTSQLGTLLAPMGVRYIVVPNSNVPVAFDGLTRPAPKAFLDALAGQLDLSSLDSDPALTIYRNTAWRGSVTSLPEGTELGDKFSDVLASDPTAFEPVLDQIGPTEWTGQIAESGMVVLDESYSSDWRLTVNGTEVGRRRAFGWAASFNVTDPGKATLRYSTPPIFLLGCALQVALWVAALWLLVRTAPNRKRRVFKVIPVEDPHNVVDVPPMRTEDELVELLSEDPEAQLVAHGHNEHDAGPSDERPRHGEFFGEAADSTPHQPEEPWEPA